MWSSDFIYFIYFFIYFLQILTVFVFVAIILVISPLILTQKFSVKTNLLTRNLLKHGLNQLFTEFFFSETQKQLLQYDTLGQDNIAWPCR